MRFAIAIALSAAAQLVVYLRLSNGASGTPVLVLPYLVLATIGAGWFAARRGAAAGALSVVLAATAYGLAIYLGPAGIGSSAGDLVGSTIALVLTFWPYIAIGAIAGALGAALRGRVLSRSPRG